MIPKLAGRTRTPNKCPPTRLQLWNAPLRTYEHDNIKQQNWREHFPPFERAKELSKIH